MTDQATAASKTPDPDSPGNQSLDDPGQLLLRWRSHPIRQGGRRLWLVVGALVVFPVGLTVLYGLFYGLMALVILGGSLSAYFLPTEYAFYIGGLESTFLGVHRRFTWQQFRSFYRDRNGVLLSPFLRPSRLENFRGVYLRFDGCAEQVMAVVTERVRVSTEIEPNTESAGR